MIWTAAGAFGLSAASSAAADPRSESPGETLTRDLILRLPDPAT